MTRWSKGRVALTGDAAWCATPLAGIGAKRAVTGGYVLASELMRSSDIGQSFSAYEEAMRAMVEKGQGVPKIAPRLMNRHTRHGINLLRNILDVASKTAIGGLATKLFASEPNGPDLSRYDELTVGIDQMDRNNKGNEML